MFLGSSPVSGTRPKLPAGVSFPRGGGDGQADRANHRERRRSHNVHDPPLSPSSGRVEEAWEALSNCTMSKWHVSMSHFIEVYADSLRSRAVDITRVPIPVSTTLFFYLRDSLEDRPYAVLSSVFDVQQAGRGDLSTLRDLIFVLRVSSSIEDVRVELLKLEVLSFLAEAIHALLRLHNGMLSECISGLSSSEGYQPTHRSGQLWSSQIFAAQELLEECMHLRLQFTVVQSRWRSCVAQQTDNTVTETTSRGNNRNRTESMATTSWFAPIVDIPTYIEDMVEGVHLVHVIRTKLSSTARSYTRGDAESLTDILNSFCVLELHRLDLLGALLEICAGTEFALLRECVAKVAGQLMVVLLSILKGARDRDMDSQDRTAKHQSENSFQCMIVMCLHLIRALFKVNPDISFQVFDAQEGNKAIAMAIHHVTHSTYSYDRLHADVMVEASYFYPRSRKGSPTSVPVDNSTPSAADAGPSNAPPEESSVLSPSPSASPKKHSLPPPPLPPAVLREYGLSIIPRRKDHDGSNANGGVGDDDGNTLLLNCEVLQEVQMYLTSTILLWPVDEGEANVSSIRLLTPFELEEDEYDVAMWNWPNACTDGAPLCNRKSAYTHYHGMWLTKQARQRGFIAERPIVDGVFEALSQLCVQCTDMSVLAASPGSPRTDGEKKRRKSSFPSLSLSQYFFRHMVKFSLDLLSSFDENNLYLPFSVQLAMVSMLNSIMSTVPKEFASNITHEYQLWDSLLSSRFYFTPLPPTDEDDEIDEEEDTGGKPVVSRIPEWMSVESLFVTLSDDALNNTVSKTGIKTRSFVLPRPKDARIMSYRRFCASVYLRHKILSLVEHLSFSAEEQTLSLMPQVRSVAIALDRVCVNDYPSDVCSVQLNHCLQTLLIAAPSAARSAVIEAHMFTQIIRCTHSFLRAEKGTIRRTPSRRIIRKEMDELRRLKKGTGKHHTAGMENPVFFLLGVLVRHDYFQLGVQTERVAEIWGDPALLSEEAALWTKHGESQNKQTPMDRSSLPCGVHNGDIGLYGSNATAVGARPITPDRRSELPEQARLFTPTRQLVSGIGGGGDFITPLKGSPLASLNETQRSLLWPSSWTAVTTLEMFFWLANKYELIMSVITSQASDMARTGNSPLLEVSYKMICTHSWREVGYRMLCDQIISSAMMYSQVIYHVLKNAGDAVVKNNAPIRETKEFCRQACGRLLGVPNLSCQTLKAILTILQSPCVRSAPGCFQFLQAVLVDNCIYDKIIFVLKSQNTGVRDDMARETARHAQFWSLAINIFSLLTWHNDITKHAFQIHTGFGRLHELMGHLHSPGGERTESTQAKEYPPQVLHALVNALLFDGNVWNPEYFVDANSALVSNPAVLNTILAILRYCSSEKQDYILLTVNKLTNGVHGVENCSSCGENRPPLVVQLIDIMPFLKSENIQMAAVTAIECLGAHIMTVPQLKAILRCFQTISQGSGNNNNNSFPPTIAVQVLSSLRKMIPDDDQPRRSFFLNGVNSGIVLPKMKGLPKEGYTMCMWVYPRKYSRQTSRDEKCSKGLRDHKSSRNNKRLLNTGYSRNDRADFVRFKHRTERVTIPTVLFSCRCGLKDGIELWEVDGELTIALGLPGVLMHQRRVINTGVYLESYKWSFLSMSHFPSPKFLKTVNNCILYIDGERVWKGVVKYKGGTFREHVSMTLGVASIEHDLTREKLLHGTKRYLGSLGAFNLFAAPLSRCDLASIYILGYDYIGCFDHSESDIRRFRQSVEPKAFSVDTLSQILLMSFHPGADKNERTLSDQPYSSKRLKYGDLSAHRDHSQQVFLLPAVSPLLHASLFVQDPQGWEDHLVAHCFAGTRSVVWTNVRDVMNSLGGINVLLPVFAHLDHPLLVSKNVCPSVLDLMGVLLQTSDAEKILQGFTITAYLMERMEPIHLSSETLNIILRMCTNKSMSATFVNVGIRQLLGNFRLWVFTEDSVQLQVISFLSYQIEEDIGRYRKPNIFGVQRLIDAFELYYWYVSPNIGYVNKEGPIYEIEDAWVTSPFRVKGLTDKVTGRRPVSCSLKTIRHALWQLFDKIFLPDGAFTPELDFMEVQALISFLLVSKSDDEHLEILEQVLKVLMRDADRTRARRFISALPRNHRGVDQHRIQPFIHMVGSGSKRVRLVALKVISSIFQICRTEGKWSDAGLDRALLPALVQIIVARFDGPLEVVDEEVYACILDTMLFSSADSWKVSNTRTEAAEEEKGTTLHGDTDRGQVGSVPALEMSIPSERRNKQKLVLVHDGSVQEGERSGRNTGRQPSMGLAGGRAICNPEFVALFMSILEKSPAPIQLRGIQDLTILLTNSSNSDCILSQYGWASCFFPLLIQKAAEPDGAGADDVTVKGILDGTLGILSLLHIQAFRRSDIAGRRTEQLRSGWEVLQNTLVHFQMTCNEVNINGMTVVWSLLEQLVHLFQRDTDRFLKENMHREAQRLLYGCIIRFIPFVEEYMFFPPAQAAGSESIVAIPDTKTNGAVPTFSFSKERASISDASSLLYSTVRLLSSFPTAWLLSNQYDGGIDDTHAPENVIRIYVRLILSIVKDTTAYTIENEEMPSTVAQSIDSLNKLHDALCAASLSNPRWRVYFVSALSTIVQEAEKMSGSELPWKGDLMNVFSSVVHFCSDSLARYVYSRSSVVANHKSPRDRILESSAKVMREVERQEFQNTSTMIDRRDKMMRDLENRLKKLSQVQKGYEGTSTEENLIERIQQVELVRISQVLLHERTTRKSCERQWRKVLRQSTSERGPWGFEEDTTKGVFWHLHEHVDIFNCRRKLYRNPSGTNYAILLDDGAQKNAENPEETDADKKHKRIISDGMLQSDLWQELLEYSNVVDRRNVDPFSTWKTDASDDESVADSELNHALSSKETTLEQNIVLSEFTVTVVGKAFAVESNLVLSEQSLRLMTDVTAVDGGVDEIKYGVSLKPPNTQDLFWTHVAGIYKRRYQMCQSAVEIIFLDSSSVFFDFGSAENRKLFFQYVMAVKARKGAPNYDPSTSASISERLSASDATEKWRQRELSNFDYLMVLNDIAGRNYHDLAQYPVFPWVLSNYESATLDLSDESNFRDLSKPIGAQTAAREDLFRAKYAETQEMYEATVADEEGSIIHGFPRHYATHYSSPHTVIWFLLRMEPFTSLAVDLGGGMFDKPDRQFFSIQKTWKSCTATECMTDVKELIPEMYYLPEMFTNTNHIAFGIKQNGEAVDDVQLPPWATSAEEFVRLHREALESEYVSAHLHEWIDLIFGYKQQGPYLKKGSAAAETACNVFFHLSYEGAVNVARLREDRPELFKIVKNVVNNFGQTPSLLFSKPHPKRRSAPLVIYKLFSRTNYPLAPAFLVYKSIRLSQNPILFINVCHRLVMIDSTRRVGTHGWRTLDRDLDPPFALELSSNRMKPIGTPSFTIEAQPHQTIASSMYAVSTDGKLLFSCGYWDGTFKVTTVEGNKTVQSIKHHFGVVSCLALSRLRKTFWRRSRRSSDYVLVTGSQDCTVAVWELDDNKELPVSPTPLHILVGHDATVTSLAVNIEMDMLVTGSEDGTAIFYDFHAGEYIQTVRNSESRKPATIEWIGISPHNGQVAIYQNNAITLFSGNGRKVARAKFSNEKLTTLIFNEVGDFLVAGGTNGILHVLSLAQQLREVDSISCGDSISCMHYTSDERHLLVGLSNGILQIRAIDNEYLRTRLKDRLEILGFGSWDK